VETILCRPLNERLVFGALEQLLSRNRDKIWSKDYPDIAQGLATGTSALEAVFQLASGGRAIREEDLNDHGDAVIGALQTTELGRWIAAVNAHHSRTYRHCLMATGVITAFGIQLGLRRADLHRLTIGALLHDIGKASVPVDILEKPGRLDSAEFALMRQHPITGRDILMNQAGFTPETIDVVAHHHEFLDGSGYPDQLEGGGIADLVRIMTIADIFTALIEPRAYKESLDPLAAYEVLLGMEGKLDADLVRAFAPVARKTRIAA
jgi:putative nucleotidyltransferase with HDIG domain